MVKEIKVSNFSEVKEIVSAASSCLDDIGVHDKNGSIADAKSILGILRLDWSRPVQIETENERALRKCLRALTA